MELNLEIKDSQDKHTKLRKEKLSYFKNKGFPNKREEEWKFTDLEKILKDNFKELNNKKSENENLDVFNLDFKHNSIILINGKLDSYDFKIENLKDKNYSPVNKLELDHLLNFIDVSKENSMQNLNTALHEGGFRLDVNSGYKFKYPIVMFNYFSGTLKNKMINNSEIIKMSRNSNATIIEFLIDNSIGCFFKNTFKYINIEDGASLNYFFVNKNNSKNFFYDYSKIKLSSNSNLKKYIFSSGIKFNKTESNIELNGLNSSSKIYSGLFLNKNNHQEIKTNILHQKPSCQSHQDIKNVLTTGSKGVFQGKVYVDQIAQKTNAYQLSKGLLLDEDCEFSTKPELEIYADDVKCSHGSTSGNIDNNALYYLKARGIKEKEAIKMIVKGFLESVLKDIKSEDIKEILENHLDTHINYEIRSN